MEILTICSVRHKGLQRLYDRNDRSLLQAEMVGKIRLILSVLDSAGRIEDMDQPAFRLHPLKGDLKGQWAVTVRANWRITFRFEAREAHDVDLVNYH